MASEIVTVLSISLQNVSCRDMVSDTYEKKSERSWLCDNQWMVTAVLRCRESVGVCNFCAQQAMSSRT